MFYRLVLISDIEDVDTKSWSLELPATIGRNPEHSVFINHDSISRTHCRLERNGQGTLTVRDLNSMNGTYVGDRKVTNRADLVTGDILQVGAVSFRVEYSSEIEDRPRPRPASFKPQATVSMTTARIKEMKVEPLPDPNKKWWQFWK